MRKRTTKGPLITTLPVAPTVALESLKLLRTDLRRINELGLELQKKWTAVQIAQRTLNTGDWATEAQYKRAKNRAKEKTEAFGITRRHFEHLRDTFPERARKILTDRFGRDVADLIASMNLDDIALFLSRLEDETRGFLPPQLGDTIFIVHGHDIRNTQALNRLLRKRWKLKPVVLQMQAGRGRHILDKFEDAAAKARFAFVVMTPDDVVGAEASRYKQPRPNVLIELGFFLAKIGRGNVCIIRREGTYIPSDLDGLSRVDFNESVEECGRQIGRELKASRLLTKPAVDKRN